jgi:hypothetical protein
MNSSSSGKPPRTIASSGVVFGKAAWISAKESVSNSTMSARPASDSDTLFIKVNFCDEKKLPMTVPAGIHCYLKVSKQPWRVLHFIDDDWPRKLAKEALWFLFRLFGFSRKIQRHELVLRE